jgi:hypothetical protein
VIRGELAAGRGLLLGDHLLELLQLLVEELAGVGAVGWGPAAVHRSLNAGLVLLQAG